MLPLLVGEQPSRSGDRYHHFPLSGAVAQTMCQMAGIPPEAEGSRYGRWTWALYDHFDCENAIQRYKPWNRTEAAATLAGLLAPNREVVVLLGRRAQDAYSDAQAPGESVVDGLDFYEWVVDPQSPTGRREVLVLPHPSSRNCVYNDRRERARAGRALREAMEKARALEATTL